jgi:beta-ribofuranosylaminobenzene 5'-phosphate synthase
MILHLVAVLQKVTGYTGGFCITVVDHERKHVGLGSTGSVLTAVAHAMNAALGSPLTTEQLRLLVGYNYVEETATGEVVPGFETGVGRRTDPRLPPHLCQKQECIHHHPPCGG